MAREKTCMVYLFLFWVALLVSHSSTSHIEIDPDGGYRKIVIAVTKEVEKTLTYRQLKSVIYRFFHDVSDILHGFTHNHTYIKEIHVLLPESWKKLPESINIHTFETYQEADIRLDTFNPSPGNGYLYTRQPRRCGERGDFVYLHPNFLIDWNKEKGKTKIREFVQEWSKLRYGLCDHLPQKRDLCFNNSSSKFIDRRHSWKVIKTNDDFRKIQDKNNFTIIPTPSIKFIKFSPIKVVLVIDPLLLQDNISTKSSHVFGLALKRFIGDFIVDGKFGFVIADGNLTSRLLQKRSAKQHLNQLFAAIKEHSSVIERNLSKGIQRGVEMLNITRETGNLVVFTDGVKLNPRKDFQFVFSKLHKLNYFLLTWTPEIANISYSPNETVGFINNPQRSLWVDIKIKSSVSECDLTAILHFQDACRLFFNKFGMAGFFPKKVKIQDYLMNRNEMQEFIAPFPNATITFDTFSCDVDIDNNLISLQVDGRDFSNNIEHLENLFYTQDWQYLEENKRKINFTSTFSSSKLTATSLWLESSISTSYQIILDSKIEKQDKTSSLVIYSFSPNNYSVEAEIINQNGWSVTLDLRDNGNGDPDITAGDKIYSRYFTNLAETHQMFSITIIAKDEDSNIVAKNTLGTVYLHPTIIEEIPPSRIGDFNLNFVDEETQTAVLSWTAPGGKYDSGSVLVYHMMCIDDVKELRVQNNSITQDSYRIEITPLGSGLKEIYNKSFLSSNTNYYCTIASKNGYDVWSDLSNIISICIPLKSTVILPTTPTPTTTLSVDIEFREKESTSTISAITTTIPWVKTENSSVHLMIQSPENQSDQPQIPRKSRLSTGGIVGIIVALVLVVVIIIIVVFIKRRRKKLNFANKSKMYETKMQLEKMLDDAASVASVSNAIIEPSALEETEERIYENVLLTSKKSRIPEHEDNFELKSFTDYQKSSIHKPILANINEIPNDTDATLASDDTYNASDLQDRVSDSNALYATIDKNSKKDKSSEHVNGAHCNNFASISNNKGIKRPPVPMPRKISIAKSDNEI